MKDIESFYEENHQKFEEDCAKKINKLYPNYVEKDIEKMVKRGVFAEKIAEIFRNWKKEKAQARAI